MENLNKQGGGGSKIKKILFSGWKKDLKKIWNLIKIIILILIVLVFISYLKGSLFGWRTDIFIKKIAYKKYNHIAPNFSFEYPAHYNIDNDPENLYGDNYSTGFKLATDSRAGCDIRVNPAGINFQKSDEEIKKVLSEDMAKSAKDFKLIKAERIKIDGQDAFSLDFTFSDPLNNQIRLNQIMTSHENNHFVFICGTGAYQYQFLEKDFNDFKKSFSWKSNTKIGK